MLAVVLVGGAIAGSASASASAILNPLAVPGLGEYLAHRPDVTAAVYNVLTGREYLYRPGVQENTASIVKADILATMLHEDQQANHGPTPGQTALAIPMITQSDNDAASSLYAAVGGPGAVAGFDRSIGMDDTTPNPAFGLTLTTAADQITLLRQIMLPGGLLTPPSRTYEFTLMHDVIPSQRWGITGGVPSSARVAIKNGWLPETGGWHVNSIGSVLGSGRDYLIAVLTSYNPSWDYGIDTIDHVAAAAWATGAVTGHAPPGVVKPSRPPLMVGRPPARPSQPSRRRVLDLDQQLRGEDLPMLDHQLRAWPRSRQSSPATARRTTPRVRGGVP